MLTENTNPLAVPQKDLDNLRAEMARTMLNVTKRTVLGLEKLSIRLEDRIQPLMVKWVESEK